MQHKLVKFYNFRLNNIPNYCVIHLIVIVLHGIFHKTTPINVRYES